MLYKSSFSIKTAVANQSGAMEADTISKNGRSSKSQMSRMSIFVAMFVVIALMAGCSKDDNNKKDVLDGTTWKGSLKDEDGTINFILSFSSPNFTLSMSGAETGTESGTYTISGNNVSLKLEDGETTTGVLSGNSLDFRDDEGPLFIKQ